MILLRPDLFIVVTVGGVVSMALRVAARWPSATIDTTPPTARELRIGAEQERLGKCIHTRVAAFFSGPLKGVLLR